MFYHQLETVFHSPCAWNPSNLPSSGDVLRLSCSLVQALTPSESAVGLSDVIVSFYYITLV